MLCEDFCVDIDGIGWSPGSLCCACFIASLTPQALFKLSEWPRPQGNVCQSVCHLTPSVNHPNIIWLRALRNLDNLDRKCG